MAFAIYNVSSDGGVYTFLLNGASLELRRDGVVVDSRPLASISGYIINSVSTDVTLLVDQPISLSDGVIFNAAGTGDKIVAQASVDRETFTFSLPNSTGISFTDGGVTSVYHLNGTTAPLTSSGTVTDLVFNLPGNTNTQLEDDGTSGNDTSRLRDTLSGYEQTTFLHPTGSLTINGLSSDSVTLNLVDDLGLIGLTINAGTTTFTSLGATTTLASVTTNAAGTTAINNGGITTTGAQSYNDAVTLGANTTLTSTGAGNLTLASTLNGAFALTANTTGTTTFGGAIGGATALTSVTTDAAGTTALNGGSITTTGAQAYNDAVTLGANTTLISTGAGNLSFASTVNGAFSLAVNTAGTTTFGGAIGGTTALTSVTTDAAGTTAMNGGLITTTGAQTYHDAVTLGATATLTGTGITFDSTVNDGGFGLTVNESGVGQFSGAISGSGGFTKAGGGTTTFAAANTYGGATIVEAGTLLVDGSNTHSATTIDNTGTLGGHGAVGAVTVESGGTLSPGASAGTFSTGNLSFLSGAHFKVELGGAGAAQSDQVEVTGSVALGGATLDASLINGFNPETATGAQLIVINNDGSDLVSGTFNGLAEGARFAIDGSSFSISYHGGDGNDVVLTVLNDPPVIGGDLAIKVAEGGSVVLTGADLTATDPDNSDAQLVFTVTGTAHGKVQLNGADTTSFSKADILAGHVSFLHDGGELDGGFSVSLSDGTTANITASIAATVDPHVNDAPVAGDVTLPSIQVNSGAHLITQAQLLANASDAEGDTLHVTDLHIDKGLGALADNHNGTWTYTPKINDDTQVDFQFTVSDGQASSNGHAKLDIVSAQSAPAIGTPGDDTFVAVTGNSTYVGGLGVDTITFDFKLTEATVTYSDNQIIIDGPTSHTVLNGIEVFKFTDGTVNDADGTPLVDDLFYYANNHDVWLAGADADAHFANYGWKEGRDPDAFFDTKGYLAHNPDVAGAGINPLTHYDQVGWKEGRDPSAIFDTKGYLAAYLDVKAAGVDPLAHFLLWGGQEGRHEVNDGHWG